MADNINEDVTDLTEEGSEDGKEQSVKKAEPKPRPRPQPKPAPAQAPAPPPSPTPGDKKGRKKGKEAAGKKRSGVKFVLIFLLVLIVLIACFAVAVTLNLFGTRDIVGGTLSQPLIRAVAWLDPEFTEVEAAIREAGDKREVELDTREADMDERESELDTRDEALIQRERQLDRRAAALDRREQNINHAETATSIPPFQRQLTDEEIEGFVSLSRSYSKMPPESAAAIIAEIYTLEDAATIIYYMAERSAGPVLAAMDPELAARITEVLLKYN